MNLQSLPWGRVDIKKIVVHFVIYFLGMGLIGGLTYLGKVDFGSNTALIGLVLGAAIDSIRKALDRVKE